MTTKKANTNESAKRIDRLGSKQRTRVALDAAYEIEHIANALLRLAEDCRTAEGDELLVRTSGHRLRDLSSVLMSSLSDDHEPVEDIRYRLTGVREEVSHA